MTNMPDNPTPERLPEAESMGSQPTFRITVQTREPLTLDDPELHGKEVFSGTDTATLQPYESRYVQDPDDPNRVFRMMGFSRTADGLLLDQGRVITETRRPVAGGREERQEGSTSISKKDTSINAIYEAVNASADDDIIVRRVYVPGEALRLAIALNPKTVAEYGLELTDIRLYSSKDDTKGAEIEAKEGLYLIPAGTTDSTQWGTVLARTRTGRIIEVRFAQTSTDVDPLRVQQELIAMQYQVNADPEEIKRFTKAMEERDAEVVAARQEQLERDKRRLELEARMAAEAGVKPVAKPTGMTREERAAQREKALAEAKKGTIFGIRIPRFRSKK